MRVIHTFALFFLLDVEMKSNPHQNHLMKEIFSLTMMETVSFPMRTVMTMTRQPTQLQMKYVTDTTTIVMDKRMKMSPPRSM